MPFLKASAASTNGSFANCQHIFGVEQFYNDADLTATDGDLTNIAENPYYPAPIISPYNSTTYLYDRNHPNKVGHTKLADFYGKLF